MISAPVVIGWIQNNIGILKDQAKNVNIILNEVKNLSFRTLKSLDIRNILAMCKKKWELPVTDAILHWIPAFAGMTSRQRRLAKVLQIFEFVSDSEIRASYFHLHYCNSAAKGGFINFAI